MAGEIRGVILDDGTHSIDYSALANTPTIPTKVSDLANDSGFVASDEYATASTAGVVKIGSGLSITDGVLSLALTDANGVSY